MQNKVVNRLWCIADLVKAERATLDAVVAAALAARRATGATGAASLMRELEAFSSTVTLNLEGLLRENGYG